MPRHYYDKDGKYRGYSLTDAERDEERNAREADYSRRHTNQSKDQAVFEFGCATIMAIAGFGAVFWHIAHGASVASMLGGILFVVIMAGSIFYSAYKNNEEAKRH